MRRLTIFALSALVLLSAGQASAQAPSPCLSSNGQVCSAHGTCVTNPAGQYCACLVGYEGFQCQRTAAPVTSCTTGAMNGVPCSGHGTCQETPSPSCVCAADFIGPQCQFLAHQAYACIAPSGQICNEHGTCMSTSAGEYCACFLNYTGAQCQTPVKGISRVPTLSVTRVLTETTSDNVDGCLGSNGAACSGNGNCVNGECDCSNGYYGQYCQYYASACANTTNGMVCSGNGRCSVSSSGAATCTCFLGYAGSMCETPVTNMPVPVPVPTTTSNCTADANGAVCSGAGICLNGACGCAEGYFGQYCQYRATPIPAPSCSNASPEGVVCSGHGQCISFAGVMQCQCTVGWVGAQCEAPFPTNTPATTTALPQQAVGSAAEDTTASLPKTIGIAAIVAAVVALLVLGVGVALLRKRRGASAQPPREEGKNTVAFIAANDSVVCEMTPAECAHIGVPMLV